MRFQGQLAPSDNRSFKPIFSELIKKDKTEKVEFRLAKRGNKTAFCVNELMK